MSLIEQLERSEELVPADCCGEELDLNSDVDNFRFVCDKCLRNLVIDATTLKWLAKNGSMSKDKLRITYLSATKDINEKLDEYHLENLSL